MLVKDPPITPSVNLKESLRKIELDAYRDEYKEMAELWRSLEGKAQGNIAIAGIFIAGAFAFVREVVRGFQQYQKYIFILALASLIVSVICSLLSLKIRTVPSPPGGEILSKFVGDLLPLIFERDFEDRKPAFINDQTKMWKLCVKKVREANGIKADFLWGAQIALFAAILLVALLTITLV